MNERNYEAEARLMRKVKVFIDVVGIIASIGITILTLIEGYGAKISLLSGLTIGMFCWAMGFVCFLCAKHYERKADIQSDNAEEINKRKIKVINKIKKIFLILVIVVAAITISICIANSCIRTLSEDDVKEMLIKSAEPQLKEIEKQLGVSNVDLEMVVYEFEYRKPTIFSNGYIKMYVGGYLISDEFVELDNNIWNEETYKKYSVVDWIGFSDVEIARYETDITGIADDFKSKNGDVYRFGYNEIFVNDVQVYGNVVEYTPGSWSDKSSGSTTCSYCDGIGKRSVTWYSEGDWGVTSYSNYKCTYCNGTGRR